MTHLTCCHAINPGSSALIFLHPIAQPSRATRLPPHPTQR